MFRSLVSLRATTIFPMWGRLITCGRLEIGPYNFRLHGQADYQSAGGYQLLSTCPTLIRTNLRQSRSVPRILISGAHETEAQESLPYRDVADHSVVTCIDSR